MTPHYSVKPRVIFEDEYDMVWEQDDENLNHFQSLKRFEKEHDARLYVNTLNLKNDENNQNQNNSKYNYDADQSGVWDQQHHTNLGDLGNESDESYVSDYDNMPDQNLIGGNKPKELKLARIGENEENNQDYEFGNNNYQYQNYNNFQSTPQLRKEFLTSGDEDDERRIIRNNMMINEKYRNQNLLRTPQSDFYISRPRAEFATPQNKFVPKKDNTVQNAASNLLIHWNDQEASSSFLRHQQDSMDIW
jgi:hypothetical protein